MVPSAASATATTIPEKTLRARTLFPLVATFGPPDSTTLNSQLLEQFLALRGSSVAVDLDQTLVADAEVVRDLVQHDMPDLPAEQLSVVSVETFERAAVDRDLVRERAAVVAAPAGKRHTLVEAEQRLPRRRLVFDHDLDVRDPVAKLGWQRAERVLDQPLEVGRRVLRIAVLHPREA